MAIKKNEEIWGIPFPIGGKWDAGYTPLIPGVVLGRFTARRDLVIDFRVDFGEVSFVVFEDGLVLEDEEVEEEDPET